MWISRKKFKEMKDSTDALLQSLEEVKKRAFIIGIERTGRINQFTFVRGDNIIKIETMGLIGDDLPGWKKDLLR